MQHSLRVSSVVVAALLIANFSTSTRAEHNPQLSPAQAVSIANDAARKTGADLAKFKAPEAHFEFVEKDATWSVFYESVTETIGGHFLVIVNDRTQSTQVLGGCDAEDSQRRLIG